MNEHKLIAEGNVICADFSEFNSHTELDYGEIAIHESIFIVIVWLFFTLY